MRLTGPLTPASPLPLQTPSEGDTRRTSLDGPAPAPLEWTRERLADPELIARQFPVYEAADQPAPVALPVTDKTGLTTAKNLNKNNPVVDVHKIGVLYVGPGQTEPLEIFGNQRGSENYERFIAGLGTEVAVEDGVAKVPTGLNPTEHGTMTYAWTSPLVVVAFHIATLMPQLVHQPAFNNKTSPIGNDYCRVIFNDSGGEYAFETIPTDFQYCNIVISPHTTGTSRTHDNPDEHNFFKVTVQRADGIPDFGPVGQFKILSAQSLPKFVRQLALMANILCKIFSEVIRNDENNTSWRRRLFLIKRIQANAEKCALLSSKLRCFLARPTLILLLPLQSHCRRRLYLRTDVAPLTDLAGARPADLDLIPSRLALIPAPRHPRLAPLPRTQVFSLLIARHSPSPLMPPMQLSSSRCTERDRHSLSLLVVKVVSRHPSGRAATCRSLVLAVALLGRAPAHAELEDGRRVSPRLVQHGRPLGSAPRQKSLARSERRALLRKGVSFRQGERTGRAVVDGRTHARGPRRRAAGPCSRAQRAHAGSIADP